MGKIGKIEEVPMADVDDLKSQLAIVSKEIDPEFADQLAKSDGHQQRVELLLVAILKELKK